jgi:hypothetical protein
VYFARIEWSRASRTAYGAKETGREIPSIRDR